MKAAETLIAWTGEEPHGYGAPQFCVGVGPLLSRDSGNWSRPYDCTGGAVCVERQKMTGHQQRFRVLRDWFELVHGYGIPVEVVHRAFLEIDEYQEIIKATGLGPDKNEPGHDPEIPHGRSVRHSLPICTHRVGRVLHVWPIPKVKQQSRDPRARFPIPGKSEP